jgi:excisionase family DNA binding protein
MDVARSIVADMRNIPVRVVLIIVALVLAAPAMADRGRRKAAVTIGDLVNQRRLYPIAEAAELLGVHRATLYNLRREGLITLIRIGARTYVAADEIERFIRDAQPVGDSA